VAAAGVLNANALLAVLTAVGANRDEVEPNPTPNPPPAPNPAVPVAPKAGAVDVVAVLPNPLNPERKKHNLMTIWI